MLHQDYEEIHIIETNYYQTWKKGGNEVADENFGSLQTFLSSIEQKSIR